MSDSPFNEKDGETVVRTLNQILEYLQSAEAAV